MQRPTSVDDGNGPDRACATASSGEVLGAVLAGGAGRRMGGAKATAVLAGRPLIVHVLDAMGAAGLAAVVVAKPETELPPLGATPVWREPPAPRHPVVGIAWALRHAQGRAVLVCPADLPLVTGELLCVLAGAEAGGRPAVLAASPDGRLQPLLGRYEPSALGVLEAAARAGEAPMRRIAAALGPVIVAVEDPEALVNVNTPADLARAQALLAARAGRGGGPSGT